MPRIYASETSSQVIDTASCVAVGATLLAGTYGLAYGVHCNVSGTYRVYGAGGTTYRSMYLVAGGCYPYTNAKLTDVSGNALSDDVLIALF